MMQWEIPVSLDLHLMLLATQQQNNNNHRFTAIIQVNLR